MTLYVKKHFPVHAMQYTTMNSSEFDKLVDFADWHIHIDRDSLHTYVYDKLHDTWILFKQGDWIVKGVKGEVYPVEEAVFAETYEKYVEDIALAGYRPETNEEKHGRG